MRVVLDTNAIVSAVLLPGSVPRQAFDKALDEGIILISEAMLRELMDVLGRPKLNKYITLEERMRFLVALLKRTELVEVTETVSDCRDEKDNKVLELALSGRADYIISGDNDLLVLRPYRGVAILRPQEFVSGRPEI